MYVHTLCIKVCLFVLWGGVGVMMMMMYVI